MNCSELSYLNEGKKRKEKQKISRTEENSSTKI